MNETTMCPKCGSLNITKSGYRHTLLRGKIQKYQCQTCLKKFSDTTAMHRLRSKKKIVMAAIRMYNEKMSLRTIQAQLAAKYGIQGVAHTTIMAWVKKYTLEENVVMDDFEFTIKGKWHGFNTSFTARMELETLLKWIDRLMRNPKLIKITKPEAKQ